MIAVSADWPVSRAASNMDPTLDPNSSVPAETGLDETARGHSVTNCKSRYFGTKRDGMAPTAANFKTGALNRSPTTSEPRSRSWPSDHN
jgi:hypothetical protein